MLYGIVYRVTCDPSGKSYIGITKHQLQRRWRAHVMASRTQAARCRAIAAAITKYGDEAFFVQAIASASCEQDLLELERLIIAQDDSLSPNGYNLSSGGRGTLILSLETRQRMRAAKLGRKMPRDAVERSAAKQRGKKRAPITLEQKAKIRAALTGRVMPQSQREAIGNGNRGKTRTRRSPSATSVRKMSESLLRRNPENKLIGAVCPPPINLTCRNAEIRERRAEGYTRKAIALAYGLGIESIRLIEKAPATTQQANKPRPIAKTLCLVSQHAPNVGAQNGGGQL